MRVVSSRAIIKIDAEIQVNHALFFFLRSFMHDVLLVVNKGNCMQNSSVFD